MPAPRHEIETAVKQAMRDGDKERLATLRLLLGAVRNREIELRREIDEAELAALVQKAIKQRREAAEQFEKGNRAELAAKEMREAVILEELLPEQVGEDEIRAAAEELIAAEGLSGPQAMGQVMPALMSRFAGRADGGTVSRIVRSLLVGS